MHLLIAAASRANAMPMIATVARNIYSNSKLWTVLSIDNAAWLKPSTFSIKLRCKAIAWVKIFFGDPHEIPGVEACQVRIDT